MLKRMMAALLAVLLVVALAACGGDNGGSQPEGSSETGSSSEAGGEESTPSTEGETQSTSGDDLKEPELVTLDIVTMASGKEESGVAQVEEAMNAILEEKFNINVKLTFLPFGSYAEQTTLLLSSGEGVDLMAVYMVPYASCATSGQIMPIDDLLEEYGQGIIEELGWDMINCGRVDGELFGLPRAATWPRPRASPTGWTWLRSTIWIWLPSRLLRTCTTCWPSSRRRKRTFGP